MKAAHFIQTVFRRAGGVSPYAAGPQRCSNAQAIAIFHHYTSGFDTPPEPCFLFRAKNQHEERRKILNFCCRMAARTAPSGLQVYSKGGGASTSRLPPRP
ncbi:hypothetical protein KCP77_17665 [Salmonella enterica subsp. enterica]|nr:hypothetical protein KCP77_17665 [Salmonella enterica subsp. enterica]